MRKVLFILAGIFGLALLGIIASVVITLKLEDPEEPPFEVRFRKGVSYSPRSALAAAEFWERAQEAGEAVRTGGDWIDFHQKGEISGTVAALTERYDLIPVIEVNFFNQDTGELLRPLSAENRAAYKEAAVEFVREHRPPYFGIGVEIDTLYRKDPTGFADFVSLFGEVYGAIKEVSPNTRVFTTFQYEQLIGLRGGLFGGKNDESAADWELLDRFPQADLIAFSTYPGIIYKDPRDIPADYYSRIEEHTDRPIAFTEIGWGSGDAIKGWESSEAEQERFVERFFSLTAGLDLEMALWSWIYPVGAPEPFASMTLFREDGTPKSAWDAWVNASR